MDYLHLCVKLEACFSSVFPSGCWEDWRHLRNCSKFEGRLQPFGQRFNSLCKAVKRHDLGPRLWGMPVAWNSDLGTDAVYVKDP